jgi:chitin synthase
MYYTPVTCSPEEFANAENNYTLRPKVMGRSTEILIAVTMYNESEEFLIRTLAAIFKNIRYFCELNKPKTTIGSVARSASRNAGQFVTPQTTPISRTSNIQRGRSNQTSEHAQRGDAIWTEDGWQKIVVVIIADGRSKCHPRVLTMLQAMGVFQDEVRLSEVFEESTNQSLPGRNTSTISSSNYSTAPLEVVAHLYEYTCQSMVESDLKVHSGQRNGIIPVQLLFCLKERNASKLNSHRWLFRGFAPVLNPHVIIQVDVGTRPKTLDSLYRLWKPFDRNPQIAGSCGEICVIMGKGCRHCSNIAQPLVASQNFEYKVRFKLGFPSV